MPEPKEDVIAETPPAEEVVETPEQVTPEEVVETSPPEVKPEVIKDNRPIENVAWETKRKLDETLPTIQRQIEELTSFVKENRQTQQPTYSKAQLQAYASEPTTTTEQRLWAYTEVDKLEKTERAAEYERLVKTTQTRSETETRKNQSAQWVAQTFPDTVIKDPVGNVVGWNNQSPLLAKANEYMNRSESLRNDPEGFGAAVKMAAFDLGVSLSANKKLNQTVGQLRKEQKKQLASVGGTRVIDSPETVSKTRMDKLKAEYSKTGSPEAFLEIVKMRKLNPWI